jgi:hypothetical protein
MATTTVTINTLASGDNAKPTATTVVAADTHKITPTKKSGKVMIRCINTTASTKVWTVVAGDKPLAGSAGQGDLTFSLTDGSTTPTERWLVLESARFMQSDGSYEITVAASTTGSITAIQLP